MLHAVAAFYMRRAVVNITPHQLTACFVRQWSIVLIVAVFNTFQILKTYCESKSRRGVYIHCVPKN